MSSPPATSSPESSQGYSICSFPAWINSKGCPGPASTLGLVKPHEVLMGHHLSLSRSLRKRPAPLSLVSPANLLRVPFILSLTKILNSSCTSVISGSPFPFGWDITGVLDRAWPAGQRVILPFCPAQVSPYMDCFIQFWTPQLKKDKELLERVKEATKMIQSWSVSMMRKDSSSWAWLVWRRVRVDSINPFKYPFHLQKSLRGDPINPYKYFKSQNHAESNTLEKSS